MARFVIGAALGDVGQFDNFVDPDALTPVAANGTLIRMLDLEGDGLEVSGTGFVYSGGIPIGGTMDRMEIFKADGSPLITVTGLATPLFDFYQTITFVGLETAYLLLAQGDDTFIGSRNGDLLLAGNGKDTVKGNGGDDYISGGAGRDVLTGGAGLDRFVFTKGDGRDRITDFEDLTGATDDVIAITQRQFNTMTVNETAGGIELTFSAKDALFVAGWTSLQMGFDDFLIV